MQELKAKLRQRVRDSLKSLDAMQREQLSFHTIARLEQEAVWRQSQSILLYAPLSDELDVWPLLSKGLAEGKAMYLPRYEEIKVCYVIAQVKDPEVDLEMGRYGIREPAATCNLITTNLLDLILVPGVAFDLHGRRLGRGRGYYDQLLSAVRGKTCGVAFDQQIVPEVPVEPHDVFLNCILTPTRWIEL